jgi:hypothetical protein
MTGSLQRIEKAFEEFRSLVEHCRNEAMSNMADIRDAYERFYRLRERYYHEDKAGTLSPIRLAAPFWRGQTHVFLASGLLPFESRTQSSAC